MGLALLEAVYVYACARFVRPNMRECLQVSSHHYSRSPRSMMCTTTTEGRPGSSMTTWARPPRRCGACRAFLSLASRWCVAKHGVVDRIDGGLLLLRCGVSNQTPWSSSHSLHTPTPFSITQRIAFAKGKSDAVAMRDGSYEPKAKRQKREAKERARVRVVSVEGWAGRFGCLDCASMVGVRSSVRSSLILIHLAH